MRTISTYIEYVLMTRHYVFVPGIGGFILRDIDASYSNHTYTPSHREVHFNRFLTKDDGMLANAYMSAEGITYDEAISQIHIEVAAILSTLDKKKTYVLGSLGILSFDSDHYLTMKKAKHFPLDPDFFGLHSINILPWKEIEAAATWKHKEVKTRQNDSEYVSIPTIWLRRAVAVAVIVICFFANFNSIDNAHRADYASMLDLNVLLGNVAPQTLVTSSWEEEWEEEEVLAEIEQAITPEKLYYIIIASCSSRADAELAVRNRESQGYEGVGIIEKDGRFRLYLKYFEVRSECESYLQQVRETTPFHDAWLLPVKQ